MKYSFNTVLRSCAWVTTPAT